MKQMWKAEGWGCLPIVAAALSGCGDLTTANMVDSVSAAATDSTQIVIDREPPFPIVARYLVCVDDPCASYFDVLDGTGVTPWETVSQWMTKAFNDQSAFWAASLLYHSDGSEVWILKSAGSTRTRIGWRDDREEWPLPVQIVVGNRHQLCEDPAHDESDGCVNLAIERAIRWQLVVARAHWWDRVVTTSAVRRIPKTHGDTVVFVPDTVTAAFLADRVAAATLRRITDGRWQGDAVPLSGSGWGWHHCLAQRYGHWHIRLDGTAEGWSLSNRPHRSHLTFEQINPLVEWDLSAPQAWWSADPDSLLAEWPDDAEKIGEAVTFTDCPVPIAEGVGGAAHGNPMVRTHTLLLPTQPLRGSDGAAIARQPG